RALRKVGMKSSPSRGCGVHIHVGLNGTDGRNHDAKSLRNLVNIMAAHESQIGRAIKIDEGRTGHYCKVVNPTFLKKLNSRKPKTMEALANCWYDGNGANYCRTSHYNDSRYHMLNLHPGMACTLGSTDHAKPTVEFRLFQFSDPADGKQNGLHAGELKAYIQLCLAMSELAKEISYASPKPQQTENEKYAFRCWMLRLGFIGDEFKTARQILLRNMDGNSAFRTA
ncbi:MAG: amidoligase family protein, partial [Oscillospiraceae bacterium]|nr:amidoligase family protein [Oscillospiraceae bacterium]